MSALNAEIVYRKVMSLMIAHKYSDIVQLLQSQEVSEIADLDLSKMLASAIEDCNAPTTKILAFSGKVDFSFRNFIGLSFSEAARVTGNKQIIGIIQKAIRPVRPEKSLSYAIEQGRAKASDDSPGVT